MSVASFIRDIFTTHHHPYTECESEARTRWRDSIHDFRNEQVKSIGVAMQGAKVAAMAEQKIEATIKTQQAIASDLRRVEQEYVRALQGNS